jgi:hypothetical protein
MKTIGKKSGLVTRKFDENWRARRDLNPPTPRSVVLSNPQQHVLTWNRSHVFPAFPAFHFMSVRLNTAQCGNTHGNTPERQITHRAGGQRLQTAFSIRSVRRLSKIATHNLDTLRYLLCVHPKSLCFSAVYPALFPRCFHFCKAFNFFLDFHVVSRGGFTRQGVHSNITSPIHDGDRQERIGGFPNQNLCNVHCRLSITESATPLLSSPVLVQWIYQTATESQARQ